MMGAKSSTRKSATAVWGATVRVEPWYHSSTFGMFGSRRRTMRSAFSALMGASASRRRMDVAPSAQSNMRMRPAATHCSPLKKNCSSMLGSAKCPSISSAQPQSVFHCASRRRR